MTNDTSGFMHSPRGRQFVGGQAQRFQVAGAEPPLTEVLRDPIVRLLMAQDCVDENEFRRYLQGIDEDDICCNAV